jgi:hypothetical protein
MGPALGITAALALIAYVGFAGGLIDLLFPEQPQLTPADYLAAHMMFMSGYERALIGLDRQHPLPYTATVTQSGPGITEPRTRFYIAKGAQ